MLVHEHDATCNINSQAIIKTKKKNQTRKQVYFMGRHFPQINFKTNFELKVPPKTQMGCNTLYFWWQKKSGWLDPLVGWCQ